MWRVIAIFTFVFLYRKPRIEIVLVEKLRSDVPQEFGRQPLNSIYLSWPLMIWQVCPAFTPLTPATSLRTMFSSIRSFLRHWFRRLLAHSGCLVASQTTNCSGSISRSCIVSQWTICSGLLSKVTSRGFPLFRKGRLIFFRRSREFLS